MTMRWGSVALLTAAAAMSCSRAPEDSLCKYGPIPESARVPAGQGAVRITAATDEYFYVSDKSGKEVNHAHLNMSAPVKPGDYDIKLNNSHHSAEVREKTLTTCTAGTIVIRGDTDEYYYAMDATGNELAHNHVGAPLAFFPGAYKVKLNNSITDAEVKPGVATEVQTVTLTVPGSTDEYYYVLDSTGAELAHNHLGRPLAFFSGARTVKVNNSTAPVTMSPGSPAEVKTGSVLVHGTTDDYYYVFNLNGTELAHQKLNTALSFIPGAYTAKVNRSAIPVKVDAGATGEYQMATLTVNGKADAYYYVLDKNGTELGHQKLNASVSLPEGGYAVKVGNDTRSVTLTAAKTTVMNW
ncbi:MAG TPA: hypothetical protein VGF59_30220 [Bryobacteraceae bacterium]|jgi:6,7-dimethyl-8-ribityllumazine synthase